jgi:hypothetical protein
MKMFGDGLSRRAAVMELSYKFETDWQLLEQGKLEASRKRDLEEISEATQITDEAILVELIDCGVRADSLHVLMLAPLVHVAWASGHVEHEERRAILAAASQEGMRPDSPGYQLLDGWLRKRPDGTMLKTWKDYVAAIRVFVAPETFEALHQNTVARARQVAESAGGFLGFNSVSREEEQAILELNQSFN